jgi:hypothetical protein
MKNITSVKIRMYRPGLGDCFLLLFYAGKTLACKMMIDFGTFGTKKNAADKMKEIANQIAGEFKGHIDVLAITHEHKDHLYGFHVAQPEFDAITAKEYWFAWTEKPGDDDAASIKKELKKKKTALKKAATKIAALQAAAPAALNKKLTGIQSIVENELNFQGLVGAAGRKDITAEALKYVKKRADEQPGSAKYFEPGEVTQLPNVGNVEVFVLGPPRDAAKMKRMSSKKEGVMYLDELSMDSPKSYVNALEKIDEPYQQGSNDDLPFDSKYVMAAFSEKYTTKPLPHVHADRAVTIDHYQDKDNRWRNIDNDWLMNADSLAMHIGNYTNNTSLALAFLLPTGDVLLFPGDAQLGNWESWPENTFNAKDPLTNHKTDFTIDELMRRTIFYKASHHGSHNGTLKERGLELMNQDKLVAMVPVDRKDPMTAQYNMPYTKLMNGLKRKTQGRLIRMDDGKTFLKTKPGDMPASVYTKFKSEVKFGPGTSDLYVEYTLKLT